MHSKKGSQKKTHIEAQATHDTGMSKTAPTSQSPSEEAVPLLCSFRERVACPVGQPRLHGIVTPRISSEDFLCSITNERDRAAIRAAVNGQGHGPTRLVEFQEDTIRPDGETITMLEKRMVLLPNRDAITLTCDRLGCNLDKTRSARTGMFSCGGWDQNTPNIDNKATPDIFKDCRGSANVKQDRNCPICDVCKHFQMGEFGVKGVQSDMGERGIIRYKSGVDQYKFFYVPTVPLEEVEINRGDPHCLSKCPPARNIPRMAHMCGYCKNNCKPSDMQKWRYDAETDRHSPIPTLPSNTINEMLTLSLNWLGKNDNAYNYIKQSDLSLFITHNHQVIISAMRGDEQSQADLLNVKNINGSHTNLKFLFDFIGANRDIFWFIFDTATIYKPPDFTGSRKKSVPKPRKNKLQGIELAPEQCPPPQKKKKALASSITYNNTVYYTPPSMPSQHPLQEQPRKDASVQVTQEVCENISRADAIQLFSINITTHSSQNRMSFNIITNPYEASNVSSLKRLVAGTDPI